MQITAQELCQVLGGKLEGDPHVVVNNLAKIEEAQAHELSFIANPKYESFASSTGAGILIVSDAFERPDDCQTTFIRVPDPYMSFTKLLELYEAQQEQHIGIEQPSFIDPSASLGEEVYIGAFAYVGKHVRIGKGVKIYPHVYIGDNAVIEDGAVLYSGVKVYHQCVIGAHSIVHSGAVIGSDGFGFAPKADGTFQKIPQTGNVTLGKHVEIGANTVIDRATLGSTVLKDGAKIDNLVQIAHNVEIGSHSVVASQAGISGSTKLGSYCMVGGQAGFVGHITIADGVKVNAQSGVSKSIDETGKAVTGSPAVDFRSHYKSIAYGKKIPELLQRIQALEEQLNLNQG